MEFLLSVGLFLLAYQFVQRLGLPLLTSVGLGLVLTWFLDNTLHNFVQQLGGLGLPVLLGLVVLILIAVLGGLYLWGRQVLEHGPFVSSR